MIISIGTDVLEIERILRPLSTPRFLERIYTESEREYLQGKTNAAESAAGFFCAKEACMKALGCGMDIGFSNIEIAHKQSGAPYLILHGKALSRYVELGGTRVHLTISHSRTVAVATVLIEGDG